MYLHLSFHMSPQELDTKVSLLTTVGMRPAVTGVQIVTVSRRKPGGVCHPGSCSCEAFVASDHGRGPITQACQLWGPQEQNCQVMQRLLVASEEKIQT